MCRLIAINKNGTNIWYLIQSGVTQTYNHINFDEVLMDTQ